MLNNYNYFAKNDIIFYPSSLSAGQNGFTVKTIEKTLVVAVFRDYWDLPGAEFTWTLFMNYPWTSQNSNKQLFIADGFGDLSVGFYNKDLNSVGGQLFTW